MLDKRMWLLLAGAAALGGCAGTHSLRPVETYSALGHEPGWTLTINRTELSFVTSSPNSVLESVPPLAQVSQLGRRYVTARLTLDIAHQPCNDAMSGVAFADTVVVIANGFTYRGCGGERVPLLNR
jgi:uncharacterized membrane protein